LKARPRISTIN